MGRLQDWWWLWRDDRRRLAKRLPQLEAADVVFASHAKSGRTWLRVMMSQVWHLTRGTPERALLEFDNFHRLDAAIPSVFFTSDYNEPERLRAKLPAIVARKRLMLMIRDPRDVAVSYYFHHSKRSHPRVRARLGLPADLGKLDIAEFVMSDAGGLPSVIDFTNRWMASFHSHPDACLIRYEDLRSNPVGELDRVMRFLGEAASPEQIQAAVEFASFERLKEKERTRFFESERLHARDSDDPDSFKVRRGKVGGYRDYFPPEIVAGMDGMVATRLDAGAGYGP